jgi:hypothetical protein
VRLRQGVLVKQWVTRWTVVLLKDKFRKRDAVSVRSGLGGGTREPYLTRHKTLPVSPFLLLSEVGSWASSTSTILFRPRALVPFELLLRFPRGVGWLVGKSNSKLTFRTGLRESTYPKPCTASVRGVAANRVYSKKT